MKYQFIHAGASSYSPSLMASQLNKITTISFTEALSTFSDLEISGVFKDGDKYSHLNNGYFLDSVLPKVIKSINPN